MRHMLSISIIIDGLLFGFLGMMFTYVISQLPLWWLFHTTTIFWKIVFPLHARSFFISGKIKVVHILCVTIGILLPIFSIIISITKFGVDLQDEYENSTASFRNNLFLSRGTGYILSRFPPLLCYGSDLDVNFYTIVLPIEVILAVGCTMMIIVLWTVHRVSL